MPVDPAQDPLTSSLHVPATALSVVGKNYLREQLPRQVFGAVSQDLVVLRPQFHQGRIGFVQPVFEVLESPLQGGFLFKAEATAVRMFIVQAQQPSHDEIGSVLTGVDKFQCAVQRGLRWYG